MKKTPVLLGIALAFSITPLAVSASNSLSAQPVIAAPGAHHMSAHQKLAKSLPALALHGIDGAHYQHELASNPAQLQTLLESIIADLRFGVTRDNADWQWQQPVVAQLTRQLLSCHDYAACWQSITQRHSAYRPLQKALQHYQAVERAGGWPKIAKGKSLKPGMADKRLRDIQTLLMLSGDLPKTHRFSSHYDNTLIAAVKSFQARHSLSADGVIGPATLAQMRVPAKKRAQQLALSLERLRQLETQNTPHHIEVNLPSYQLTAYHDGKAVTQMDVIVGKKSRPTPLFENHITIVGLNPTWTPTSKILSKDLLPKFQRDPGYAERGGYVIRDRRSGQTLSPWEVDWHYASARDISVVQQPGRRNALGKVKFLLPKNNAIYLHDTASPSLFRKSMRAMSSGCIRLSDPKALLDYVASVQEGGRFKKLQRYYQSDKKRHVKLDTPVKVITTYFTAWVDENGKAQFYSDIYRKDDRLQLAMDKATPVYAMR